MKKFQIYICLVFLMLTFSTQSQIIYSYHTNSSKWVFIANEKTLDYYPNKSFKRYFLTEAQTKSFVTLFEEAKHTKKAQTKSKKSKNPIVEIESENNFNRFFLKEKSDINLKLFRKFNELLILKPKQ